jgi:hypothetical protein
LGRWPLAFSGANSWWIGAVLFRRARRRNAITHASKAKPIPTQIPNTASSSKGMVSAVFIYLLLEFKLDLSEFKWKVELF